MASEIGRRGFLAASAGVVGAVSADSTVGAETGKGIARRFELGTVTYNVAKDWDLATLIKKCEALDLKAVELRTSHKHGVEPSLSKEQRQEVRRQFSRTKVKLFGLGSACEYHSSKAEVVRQNIELTQRFVELAADVGATGVKVRPNGLATKEGIPVDTTLGQIGRALAECGRFAEKYGVEIWLEVHGAQTSHPPYIRKIIDACACPAVGVTWNSNASDLKDGSIREYFSLLRPEIRCVHLHDLWDYPYRELFGLLNLAGYDRFTMIEMAGSPDVERLLRYYRRLWDELSRPA